MPEQRIEFEVNFSRWQSLGDCGNSGATGIFPGSIVPPHCKQFQGVPSTIVPPIWADLSTFPNVN